MAQRCSRSPRGCSYGLTGLCGGGPVGLIGRVAGSITWPWPSVNVSPSGWSALPEMPSLPSMMQPVTGRAQPGQIPRVGRAVMLVVDDVMHLQPAGLIAPRHPTLSIPSQHEPAGAVRHLVLGAADAHRPAVVGEHRGHGAVAQQHVAQPVRDGEAVGEPGRDRIGGVDEPVDPEPFPPLLWRPIQRPAGDLHQGIGPRHLGLTLTGTRRHGLRSTRRRRSGRDPHPGRRAAGSGPGRRTSPPTTPPARRHGAGAGRAPRTITRNWATVAAVATSANHLSR